MPRLTHLCASLLSQALIKLAAPLWTALLLGSAAYGSERFIGRDFLVQSWDLDDGLHSTRIAAVTRTPDGYAWVTTLYGVARFDGARFTIFDSTSVPAFKDANVSALLAASDGTLWIGTTRGRLLKNSGGVFTIVDLKGADRGVTVSSLAEDSQGAIWAGTLAGSLIRIERCGIQVFDKNHGWTARPVARLLAGDNGKVWALAGGKLMAWESERWQSATEAVLDTVAASAVTHSRDGGLWLAGPANGNAGGRIFKLSEGRLEPALEPYPWPQDSPRSLPTALLEDSSGRLWCGMAGRGVFYWSAAGWQQLAPDRALSRLEILCLVEDEGGVVWIGSRTAGLYKARPRLVNSYALPPEMEQNTLVTACAARDGSIWGGTDGAGVFRWHGLSVKHFGTAEGLTELRVSVLLEDARTNLWAGTQTGVFLFKEGRFELHSRPELRQPVFSLMQDRQGRMCAGIQNGVVCWDDSFAKVYGTNAGLPAGEVRSISEDREEKLWVAVSGAGLFSKVGDRFERYELPNWSDSGPGGRWRGRAVIRAMHWDDEGVLWLATWGYGLCRIQGGNFQDWQWWQDGLPSSHLLGMLEDGQGNLWLSSENGVFGLPKKTLNEYRRGQSPLVRPWRLTSMEGLPHKVCSGVGQPTAVKSADGRLFFPDGAALAAFDPATIPLSVRTWAPIVEEALADGVLLSADPDGVLRTKSGARALEFHFSSPNILSPERLRFRYRLDGLEKRWTDAGNLRLARYNRLPPGTYKFSIEANGPDGDWIAARNMLRLEIVPRWYERLSTRVAGVVLLLGIFGGIVWFIERTRSKRRLETLKMQQAMDRERQRIAADIHDELGAGLTEISILGDGLRRDMQEAPALESVAREIATRARTLTRSMDAVVWAISPKNDTLESFLTYLNRFTQEYLSKAGVRCRWDVPLELPEIPLSAEVRHHLFLASKEAVHNIVKHASASEVWIRLKLDAQKFTLEIEDNGKGFDPSLPIERGNGLANMSRRLEESRGHFEVRSVPDKGTRVTFEVLCPLSPLV